MGYFTWTDAKVKTPRLTKWGDYWPSQKIGYDCFCKVVCPDDTEIIENCYNGYGSFGGHDIYELVVDWNREDLPRLFSEIVKDHDFGCSLKPVAELYSNLKVTDAEVDDFCKKLFDSGKQSELFFAKEWKRNIGIAIGCSEKRAKLLKYPIKITTLKEHRSYNSLYPSYNCQ